MLKRRARAARARLPAGASLPAAELADTSLRQAGRSWSEPELQPGENLWLCVSFSNLNTENKDVFNIPERLYRWAYRYTPVLSGEGNLLFLEVAASLRLFGGLQALRVRLEAELRAEGYAAVLACALTPRAAQWLAVAGHSCACPDSAAVRRAVAALPISATGWPDKVQRALGQMGLRTLGCCLKLPRSGFARRVGKQQLQTLDEALGSAPQLLRHYTPPLRFHRRVGLDEESIDHARLLEAAQAAFDRLGRFLRRRQAAVEVFDLHFAHRGRAPTVLRVGVGRPCTDTASFAGLTGLRLERLVLTAPVTAVELRAHAAPAPRGTSLMLPGIEPGIEPGHSPRQGDGDTRQQAELLARLRARLGAAQVYRLELVAEHRPERAWQVSESGAEYRVESRDTLQRPLWLLSQPRRIAAPVTVLCPRAAERIESGWWDGADMRRDYYRVSGPAGSDWWVYQDCRSRVWYLHGLFG